MLRLRSELLPELVRSKVLDSRGSRADEFAHLLKLRHDDLALNAKLGRQFVDAWLRCSSTRRQKS